MNVNVSVVNIALSFRNFKIFNCRNGQEGQTASVCRISSKLLQTAAEMWLFVDFLKMAAAAILDFWNFKFLTVGTVKRVELHHLAKCRQNRSNRGRDMAIFRFFPRWRPSAILDL